MNSISKLFPDMSAIAMFFQIVVELTSPSQAIGQGEPTLKTSPGAGLVGTTSARTRKGAAKTKSVTKVLVENISCICFLFWSKKKRAVGNVKRLIGLLFNGGEFKTDCFIYVCFLLIFCFKGVCLREGGEIYIAAIKQSCAERKRERGESCICNFENPENKVPRQENTPLTCRLMAGQFRTQF